MKLQKKKETSHLASSAHRLYACAAVARVAYMRAPQ
jgi:hypothetical protein